jgi:PAS domain-containing protein
MSQIVDLQGGARGYAFVSGAIDTQESVVRSLRNTFRERPIVARPRQEHAPHLIRLTCSITPSGHIVSPNQMMTVALGYSREELEGATVGALLRPGENVRETESDIFRKFDAVRSGETARETFSSFMIAKGGARVEVTSSVAWNSLFERWDIVAEVDANRMPSHPQFATPLDRVPMLEWLVAQQQQRLRELALQVQDRMASDAQERHLRSVARDIVHETLLDYDAEHPITPLKKADRGEHHGGAPRKYDDPEEVVRQAAALMASADDFWGMTVQDVCDGLDPKLTRNQLIEYLVRAGRMRKAEKGKRGDSLKETLRVLGREALERLTVIAIAATNVTVGVNLIF